MTTVVVSAICGGLAGYLTTYARIRYEIKRNARKSPETSRVDPARKTCSIPEHHPHPSTETEGP